MRTFAILAAGLVCLFGLSGCRETQSPQQAAGQASLQALLGQQADAAGFARALAPRAFSFPADYGPHPRFRTEWWYFTGTLRDAAGRRFGYEFTVFRFALTPRRPPGDSPWRSNQVYMADFALSDIAGRRFLAYQRLSRGALGLAGAQAAPFRVWVDDWSVASGGHGFPWHLRARRGHAGVDLTLTPVQGVVLNGDRGLSRKGPQPGDASYYYSMPRLATTGTVEVGGKVFRVSGQTWMDREWSTSALAPDQVGWDWFGLRLSDGADLMFYRLRDRDGRTDPYSGGTYVTPGGDVIHLPPDAVETVPTDYWTAPSGVRYPVGWRLTVPTLGLSLTVRAMLDAQLLPYAVPYWEGAVSVAGNRSGRPVDGEGYLELTGYTALR